MRSYAKAYAANQRLHALRLRVHEAQEEADQANAAKSAFLSGLNHELRTPLNAITGFTGLVREQADLSEEKRAEYLDHVLSSAGILLERIDAILRAASGQDGPVEEEDRGADLLPVLRRVLTPRAKELFVSKADIGDHLPALAASEDELERVLTAFFDHLGQGSMGRQAIGCTASAQAGELSGVLLTFEVLSAAASELPDLPETLGEELEAAGLTMRTDLEGGRVSYAFFCPALTGKRAA